MRIQHNIMAMNAYRNYNNNSKALSGNLEKLSSGYKINRAGDDAAGLAISEKMRAQITGLNAAQKNVKDGISLVKTAEGAMQEIQDMLNRMDYLATQSANGTYQDEVDREALQKEVNQLNEEINRIADSANFNGIKLLDGTWDADAKTRGVNNAQKALDAAQAALDKAKEPVTVAPVVEAKTPEQIKGMMLGLVSNGGAGTGAVVGTNTVLETEKIEYQQPSFHVNLNGTSYTMASDGTDQTGGTPAGTDGTTAGIKLTINGQGITLTEADMKSYLTSKGVAAGDIKAGYTLDSKDLAAAFVHKLDNAAGGAGVAAAGNLEAGAALGAGQFGDTDYAWDVRVDDNGESLVFEFADINKMPDTKLNKYFDTKLDSVGTIAPANANAKATKSTYVTDTYTASTNNAGTPTTDAKFTVTVTDKDGGTTTYEAAGLAETASTTDVLAALKDAVDADGNKLSAKFDITEATGKYTFTAKEAGAAADAVTGVAYTPVTTAGSGGATASLATTNAVATPGADAYKAGLTGYINAGTEVVIAGVPAESEQLASTTLNFSDLDIVDGMEVKLGDTTYTFAVGKDSTVKGDNVVDLKDIDAAKLKTVANGGTQADRDMALSRLTEAAKGNATFTVSHEKNGTAQAGGVDQIGLKQKQEVKETTDMTTLDKFAGYIGVSAVNEAKTAEAQKAADEVQKANVAAAQAKVDAAKKTLNDAQSIEGGKALNLQIGDTGEDFNQLGVKIGSMKTTALGVDGLSISTADDAREAIDTIKNAINYVSSVRGDLGAYQNRLDHTANNLSVMAENIQDAESTIRDTDVAEEMMSYVKNNILVQSAQAMLAQANQVPQGVLQLLG